VELNMTREYAILRAQLYNWWAEKQNMGQTLVLPHFNSMVFPLGYDERVHPALNVSLTEARQPHTHTHRYVLPRLKQRNVQSYLYTLNLTQDEKVCGSYTGELRLVFVRYDLTRTPIVIRSTTTPKSATRPSPISWETNTSSLATGTSTTMVTRVATTSHLFLVY
jgi:hypothetical protein